MWRNNFKRSKLTIPLQTRTSITAFLFNFYSKYVYYSTIVETIVFQQEVENVIKAYQRKATLA